MDKDRTVETIKDWIQIDNDIKLFQKQIREKRAEKNILSSILVDTMRNNEIDCFDVNDGSIVYTKKKIKGSLTKTHLINSLLKLFNDDSDKANLIASQILESREEKIKEVIQRKCN
jgi:nitrogen regulatory protein PII-like uncharacterized protein